MSPLLSIVNDFEKPEEVAHETEAANDAKGGHVALVDITIIPCGQIKSSFSSLIPELVISDHVIFESSLSSFFPTIIREKRIYGK